MGYSLWTLMERQIPVYRTDKIPLGTKVVISCVLAVR